MTTKDERKAYWNDSYYRYWKARVDEAGTGHSQVVPGDPNTEDDAIYMAIFDRHGFNGERLLEVGCAWGRMFPVYKAAGMRICGADISRAMIEAARGEWGNDEAVEQLVESDAENLPFEDETFDSVSCLATFDATWQHEALASLLRVLRVGGRLYLTGKNDHYEPDDDKALDAEEGARRKDHPNYFTDVACMQELLQEQGHRIVAGYYFPRRGDFAAGRYLEEMPARFYEWLLVIDKQQPSGAFPEFSSDHSKTWHEERGGD